MNVWNVPQYGELILLYNILRVSGLKGYKVLVPEDPRVCGGCAVVDVAKDGIPVASVQSNHCYC